MRSLEQTLSSSWTQVSRQVSLDNLFLLIEIAVGVVFIFSATPKIAHPVQFLGAVEEYQILDPGAAKIVASALPWIELLIGAGLVLRRGVADSLAAAVVLCLAFALTMLLELYRGLSPDCGCFGAGAEKVGPKTLSRTLAIGFCCLAALARHRRKYSWETAFASPPKAI